MKKFHEKITAITNIIQDLQTHKNRHSTHESSTTGTSPNGPLARIPSTSDMTHFLSRETTKNPSIFRRAAGHGSRFPTGQLGTFGQLEQGSSVGVDFMTSMKPLGANWGSGSFLGGLHFFFVRSFLGQGSCFKSLGLNPRSCRCSVKFVWKYHWNVWEVGGPRRCLDWWGWCL